GSRSAAGDLTGRAETDDAAGQGPSSIVQTVAGRFDLPATVASGPVRRALWANNPGQPVDVPMGPARVGDVPDIRETEMNGGGSAYGLDDHIYQRVRRG